MVFHDPPPDSVEHRHQSMLFLPGEDATPASPMHLAEGCTTPFLLTYGSEDILAIIENNEQMYSVLQRQGAPVQRLVLPGHDHFDTALAIRRADGPWMQTVRRWMVSGSFPDERNSMSLESRLQGLSKPEFRLI
jgi:acetyl esterase/lipase